MRSLIINFTENSGKLLGRFNASLNNNKAASAVWDQLPIAYRACFWGQSLWIQLPIICERSLEESTLEVEQGSIAYWYPGKQIHIYFGPTLVSTDHRPMPPGPVTIIGSLTEDTESFRRLMKSVPWKSTYIQMDKTISI